MADAADESPFPERDLVYLATPGVSPVVLEVADEADAQLARFMQMKNRQQQQTQEQSARLDDLGVPAEKRAY